MKKVKIGVFEFDYHPEVLRNTSTILKHPEIELFIFASDHIIKKSKIEESLNQQIQLFYKNKNQSIKSFLQYHLDKINSLDIILFNTIASHYKSYLIIPISVPFILRIHNSNAYFNTLRNTYSPIFQAFFIWKDFSHFIRNTLFRRDIYWRNKLLKKIDYFAFPNEIIKNYAQKELNVPPQKTLNLPFSYHLAEIKTSKHQSNEISISIIGKIDKRNRDYFSVIEAFKNLSSFILKNNVIVNLYLLGDSNSMFGKKIVKRLEKLQTEKLRIHSFKGFVENRKFNDIISKTDFLLSPVKVATRFTIYKEFYGKTKISGSLNDILLFQKPAIIPKELSIPNEYNTVTESYDNAQELSGLLKEWISNKPFKNIDFSRLTREYSLEKIQTIYLNSFQKILNKNSFPKGE